jgi:hypothetical protein
MPADDRQYRSEVLVQRPWFVIVSPLKRALASGAVALVVFWSGGALDMFVTRNYLPRSSLMLAGALIALLVGTLVFRGILSAMGMFRQLRGNPGFRVADHTVIHSATSDEHCTQAQKL